MPTKEPIHFIPMKRTALDGKVWWCVWDSLNKKWSSYICFGKYKLKRDCQFAIDYYTQAWRLV